jgi:hypothetical protein
MVGGPDDELSTSKTINPFASDAMKSGSPENSSKVIARFVVGAFI